MDYFNERLYWADAKLSVIGSVRLDGTDPVVAVSNVKNSSVSTTAFSLTARHCSKHLNVIGGETGVYNESCVYVCGL